MPLTHLTILPVWSLASGKVRCLDSEGFFDPFLGSGVAKVDCTPRVTLSIA